MPGKAWEFKALFCQQLRLLAFQKQMYLHSVELTYLSLILDTQWLQCLY